jgi:hypothetical protein
VQIGSPWAELQQDGERNPFAAIGGAMFDTFLEEAMSEMMEAMAAHTRDMQTNGALVPHRRFDGSEFDGHATGTGDDEFALASPGRYRGIDAARERADGSGDSRHGRAPAQTEEERQAERERRAAAALRAQAEQLRKLGAVVYLPGEGAALDWSAMAGRASFAHRLMTILTFVTPSPSRLLRDSACDALYCVRSGCFAATCGPGSLRFGNELRWPAGILAFCAL